MKKSKVTDLRLYIAFFVVSVTEGLQVIKCPHLKPMHLSRVQNPNCISEGSILELNFNCVFTCPQGYIFEKAKVRTVTRYCTDSETWSGEDDVCIDIQPPRFSSCPPKQVVSTTFRTNIAKNVEWKTPTYYDNSIPVVGDHLTLVEYNGYTSPRDFGMGTHLVKYTVKDKSGLEDYCQFEIIVKDNEAPYYTRCPENIEKTYDPYDPDGFEPGMRVSWEEPWFKDNSGEHLITVYASVLPGTFFPKGRTQVVYTAMDSSGNVNKSCSFEVIIKEPSCPRRTVPINGAVVCYQAGEFKICNLYCQEGYDFPHEIEDGYICTQAKWYNWKYGPFLNFDTRKNWPDCSVRKAPSSGTLKIHRSFHYKGNCIDEAAKDDLKKKFESYYKTGAGQLFCLTLAKGICIPVNIRIYCGANNLV